MPDILQHIATGYIPRSSNSVLGVPWSTLHDHTHQV